MKGYSERSIVLLEDFDVGGLKSETSYWDQGMARATESSKSKTGSEKLRTGGPDILYL